MKEYLTNRPNNDRLIDFFDELPLWSAPFGLKLLDFIDYKPGLSVLDIGFGSGFPLTEIAMRLGESSLVYGIDPWKEAVAKVREKIEFYSIRNIAIIEGVAEYIPLDDQSIDLITSNNGLNNVQDIDKVLSECSRLLRQGGQFVQTMNTAGSMIEFYTVFERVLSELDMHHEIDLMHQHIEVKRPPVEKLLNNIRSHGFTLKDLEYDQFNYTFVNGTALLNHYFIRLAFMDSWIALLPKDKVKEIFERIETYLNEQSQLLGSLKLSIPYVLINMIRS
ncbi:MAG: class I SAM-dependent methyltransferase [Dysgonomonas sp.]